ncbi:MAG: L,D-transpeptidase family protein [Alphaproteobacteria bacterium]|nr:L,D-transpeptidase family protein [Alphaproteobacteria bacterium]
MILIGSLTRRFATVLALLASIAAGFATTGPAGAQQWNPFADISTSTSNSGSDIDFTRRWQANPPPGYPTLSPANLAATKTAIERYEGIVKAGGWNPVPATKLAAGYNDPSVEILRKRLQLTGELESGEAWMPQQFDYSVEKAVKRFQATNGLAPTGIVDKRTRAALNVTAKSRLEQLKKGLSRIRAYASKTKKGKYVVVNIPAAQIEAVEDDKVVSRHAGVVGKVSRKSPTLSSSIHELNFNPVWRLPPTVVSQDLIPKGRQMEKAGKDVLVKYGIDAYDGSGRKLDPEKINWRSSMPHGLSYRQKPGKENPLGFVKINFHNSYSVYLHDTPSDSLFGRNFRAASSGCIRVHNIEELAAWLLEDKEGWSKSQVIAMRESGESKDVRLKKPVRLYFAYLTAWATSDGVVQFRPDLYGKDGVGNEAGSY